jgi:hypothetical protein
MIGLFWEAISLQNHSRGSSRERPPIKRPSVKENTSPMRGIGALLMHGPVAYILRLCRYVSRVVSVDPACYKASYLVIRSALGSET